MSKFILWVSLQLLVILLSSTTLAQEKNIAQFAVWQPKEGLEQNFEMGYQKHLLWHKTNGDTWNWYGWYIVSGPRFGYFIDATFDHSWNDFNSPVKPAGDAADNQIHTDPFGNFKTAFKVSKVSELSSADDAGLKSKFTRLVTISVNDTPLALKTIERLRNNYAANSSVKNFMTYKMVDGGDVNQIILMLGFKDYNEYGKTENLPEELSAIESSLKEKSITAVSSETLVYRADMSLFAQ